MNRGTSRKAVVFTAPTVVEIRDETIGAPGPGEILVRTRRSAISAGTELLVLHGLAPASMSVDATIPALPGTLTYPLKYGYASVGQVQVLGPDVDPAFQDALVFSFQPHQTHFVASASEVIRLPAEVSPDVAVLLPSAETAVNLVLDGRPLVGERVIVFGQGMVGLLTTAILAAMPLATLVTLDRHPRRRKASLDLGAQQSLDPAAADTPDRLAQALADPAHAGADLAFEVSGDPAVLDQALRATGFDGRIVIGSWYGEKRAALDLGGAFHRSRIRLVSSQVSTIAPALRGRWTPARRLATALALLLRVGAERLITHRIPFQEAADAYRLLTDHPEDTLQIVLTYPDSD